MKTKEYFYKFVPTDWGWKIIPKSDEISTVVVIMTRQGYFEIFREEGLFYNDKAQYRWDMGPRLWVEPQNMFDFFKIMRFTMNILYSTWKERKINGRMHYAAPRWMIERTRKNLISAIHPHYKKLIAQFHDQDIVDIHKVMFSTFCGGSHYMFISDLINIRETHPYIVEDIKNFYAARVALATIGQRFDKPYEPGLDLGFDWMGFYEADKNVFVRKTISMTKGFGLPYWYTSALARMSWLEETIKTRTRMLAYGVLVNKYYRKEIYKAYSKVLLRSSDEDIEHAMEMMWEELRLGKFDKRRTRDLHDVLSTIYDVCNIMDVEEIARCKITGITKRSIKYHREIEKHREEERLLREKRDKVIYESKTAQPPIPLPNNPHITFLDTYKSVVAEGDHMEHCVAGYANGAVSGQYYLFHIDYNDTEATAQVSLKGNIMQIHGPRNRDTEAVHYGRKKLAKWGRNLKGQAPILQLTTTQFNLLKQDNPYAFRHLIDDEPEIEVPNFQNEEPVAIRALPNEPVQPQILAEVPF